MKSGAANLTSSWTLNVKGSKAEVLKSSSVYDDDDPMLLRKEFASSIYNIQPIVRDIYRGKQRLQLFLSDVISIQIGIKEDIYVSR